MTEVTTTIENRAGMHARPASLFVQTASKFKSKIQIRAKGKTVDARSILMIMSMGLVKGTEITISADGYDEEEAVVTLRDLIDARFGEEGEDISHIGKARRKISREEANERFGGKFRKAGD